MSSDRHESGKGENRGRERRSALLHGSNFKCGREREKERERERELPSLERENERERERRKVGLKNTGWTLESDAPSL